MSHHLWVMNASESRTLHCWLPSSYRHRCIFPLITWKHLVLLLRSFPHQAIIYYSLSRSSASLSHAQTCEIQGTGTKWETSNRDPGFMKTPVIIKSKGRKSTLSLGLIYKLLEGATVVLQRMCYNQTNLWSCNRMVNCLYLTFMVEKRA